MTAPITANGVTNTTSKVLVIGLDGATFDLIDPMIVRGELPNLSKLISNGTRDELLSTIHPFSAPAWTSFMTGKNPGKHGIFDFTQRQLNSYEPEFVTSHSRKAKSLWRILSEAGKSVGVINVPITYPPEEVKGFLVAGLGTPGTESPFTYPPELQTKIQEKILNYSINVPIRDYIRGKRLDVFLQRLHFGMEQRFNLARVLFTENDLDFAMVVFGSTDKVQHFFWKYMDGEHPLHRNGNRQFKDAIFDIYKKADTYIGKLIKDLGDETTVFIVSDHGQGGNNNKTIYINKWLESHGLLKFMDDGLSSSKFKFGLIKQLVFASKRLLPRNIKDKFKRISTIRSKVETLMRGYLVDWSNTKAYADELRGNIYINLKGREPDGIVETGGEYETLRDYITAKLYELSDPETGEKIVEKVFKREDIYEGEYTVLAPDLLFLQDPNKYSYVYRRSHNSRDDSFFESFTADELENDLRPNADHRPNGILILSGRHVKRNHQISGSSIMDLAPTILFLMGLPVPRDMDGKILIDGLEDSFVIQHPPHYSEEDQEVFLPEQGSVYSSAEEEKIKESLKGLGYLE